MGAGDTEKLRKSSALSWLTGTSMRRAWPGADTTREWPKEAAWTAGHISNDAASAPTKGLVLNTKAKDDDIQRDICIFTVHPKQYAACGAMALPRPTTVDLPP